MKKILIILAATVISACSNTPHVVENKDLFVNYEIVSHEVCGGGHSYNGNGDLSNPVLELILKNLVRNSYENENVLIDHMICLNLVKGLATEKNITSVTKSEASVIYKQVNYLINASNDLDKEI